MISAAARRPRDCRTPAPCKACGAPILWVTWSRSGRRMPINAEAKQPPFGQVVVTYRPVTNQLIAEKARGGNAQGRNLYESHFATCAARHEVPNGSARVPG